MSASEELCLNDVDSNSVRFGDACSNGVGFGDLDFDDDAFKDISSGEVFLTVLLVKSHELKEADSM